MQDAVLYRLVEHVIYFRNVFSGQMVAAIGPDAEIAQGGNEFRIEIKLLRLCFVAGKACLAEIEILGKQFYRVGSVEHPGIEARSVTDHLLECPQKVWVCLLQQVQKWIHFVRSYRRFLGLSRRWPLSGLLHAFLQNLVKQRVVSRKST
ncbi:hypothetical protein [Aestuariivirga sp.]|uniref:hypothetical protein n=1 Tax=Aestuariivirga sp. TaxID=2650926 RepID=UPI003783BE48